MNVGKTLSVQTRAEWRSWLAKNHRTAAEIWLLYYKKASGKKRIEYNAAVEEALCYGWIDSTVKSRNAVSWVQRFSPRRPNSRLSQSNKERIRRLIASGKMRKAGLSAIAHHLSAGAKTPQRYVFPDDILNAIRKHPNAWKHYQKFPLSYRRIRISWIDESRSRPEYFAKRLRYFISKTEKNERFGMVQ